jgi:hypothetical protein
LLFFKEGRLQMAVQASVDRNVIPFIMSGRPLYKEGQTIAQIGGRTAVLYNKTLLGKVAATGKWLPCDDATATDGTVVALGIYVGEDITAAALAAADVVDCPVIVGGAGVTFDKDQLIVEEATSPPLTIDSIITVGTNDKRSIRDRLASQGLFAEDTVAIDGYENS